MELCFTLKMNILDSDSTRHVCLQGLAYQLIDDILDFTGTTTSLGKGSLSDIHHVPFLTFLYCYIRILNSQM